MNEPDTPIKGNPLSILLVEDNDSHAQLVTRNFQDSRLMNPITHVKDGALALDYIYNRGIYSEEPVNITNLVLLDLRLPKIDGLEVLKIIKSDPEKQHTPVVILTTSAAEMDIARAYEYHANSYLTKPVDFEKFNKLMHDLHYYWLCWNVPPSGK